MYYELVLYLTWFEQGERMQRREKLTLHIQTYCDIFHNLHNRLLDLYGQRMQLNELTYEVISFKRIQLDIIEMDSASMPVVKRKAT